VVLYIQHYHVLKTPLLRRISTVQQSAKLRPLSGRTHSSQLSFASLADNIMVSRSSRHFSYWLLNIKWNSFRITKLINQKGVEHRSIVYYEYVEIDFDKIMSRINVFWRRWLKLLLIFKSTNIFFKIFICKENHSSSCDGKYN